ncbi:hypothetical protein CEP52_001929 [Fusarium oligoseptatum]|uniref:Uncharacterized protein n=1 Tax=Fusarium oligoseptatum TaxID=2604345 RepID=A0A428UGK7_9HYPO|nr:hypothetical protein CEP52_001929 [Fusarium oligoseptatum]
MWPGTACQVSVQIFWGEGLWRGMQNEMKEALASTGSHSFPPHFINTKSRAESGTLCGNLSWTVSYIPRTITRHLILSPAASIDAGIQATSAPSLWLQPSSAYVVGSHQSRPSAYHCATHAGNTIQHYSAPVRSITHHRPPVHQPFSQPGPDLDPCFLVPVLFVDPEDARRTRHRHRAPVCKKETNKVTYHHPQHPPTLV